MLRHLARLGGGLGAGVGLGAYGASKLDCEGDASALLYRAVVMPALRAVDAEMAHRAAVLAARFGLAPSQRSADDAVLRTVLWGREVVNPIGLAAGFDKDGEAVGSLMGVGFGLVEVGSVTPLPQPGNPKPRVFRLVEDRAVINRYGFNSCGHAGAAAHLAAWRDGEARGGGKLLGVNLGKNKTSPSAADDYAAGVRALGGYADYIVVNVSSPNTPGLRDLQESKSLRALLRAVRAEVDALPASGAPRPPLVLKIAPDLTEASRRDIAKLALAEKVDGLLISNTTVGRPETLSAAAAAEAGGLSGAPLLDASTELLSDMYSRTGGKLTLIGAGGVSSGADAYRKIRAGASAVQLYSSLVYGGPPLVPRIKRELAALLEADGYTCVADAVGADHAAGSSARRRRARGS